MNILLKLKNKGFIIKSILALLFIMMLSTAYATTELDLSLSQVFHRGNYDEPDSLDPQKSLSAPDYNILQDLYEGLTTFDINGNVILGQAKSYTVSADKMTYSFVLKDNLKWSNGELITAYDFEYGIKRNLDPDVGSGNVSLLQNFKNCKNIINNHLSIKYLGVRALSKDKLEINLENPTPFLLNLLTHHTFAPVYRPNIIKYGDKFTNPGIHISNGPFKLSKWVVNSHLSLVKNNYYIDSNKVKLKKVVFYPINNPSYELKRYRAGDIDYTSKIPSISMPWVKKHYSNQLYTTPMLAAYYFNFNVTKPPFSNNKELRKALALSIDKEIITNNILGASRTSTDRFVPRNINYYNAGTNNDEFESIEFNKFDKLELAKQYYNKSGYSRHNPLKIKLLYHSNESNKTIATAVASMWKKALGVQTELVNQEWKVFLQTRLDHNETEVFREGWIASYNDPTAFLDLFESNNPQNSSGYTNKDYDYLLEKAQKATNVYTRANILRQAEDLLLDDAPVIPIYTPQSFHLVKPNVGGVNVNSFDLTLDKYIYMSDKNKVSNGKSKHLNKIRYKQ